MQMQTNEEGTQGPSEKVAKASQMQSMPQLRPSPVHDQNLYRERERIKKPTSLLDPEARLKLTILSLSGIQVRTNKCREFSPRRRTSPSKSSCSTKSFAITASVSFTGSCDPEDMLVVSSGLCSTTGRLSVESKPIVVPNGMTDGLIAVWEDSPQNTYYHQHGSIYSTAENVIFGKAHGSISACPFSRPHLFVNVRDYNTAFEEVSDDLLMLDSNYTYGKTQDSAALSSLSFGPDMDETEISSCQSVHSHITGGKEIKKIQVLPTLPGPRSNPTSPQANTYLKGMHPSPYDKSSPSPIPSLRRSPTSDTFRGEDYSFSAVINTPSQTIEPSSVPEILEMQISLDIQEVPILHHTDGDDAYNLSDSIQSACVSSSDGGGAVAHLVLFPDIIGEGSHHECENDENDENDFSPDDGHESQNVRILELPVRKRFIPMLRSSSSVSGLTSRCDTTGSASRSKRLLREPEAYVDLDDHAMIRVKIELCTEDDIQSFDKGSIFPTTDDWNQEEEQEKGATRRESAIYTIIQEQAMENITPQNSYIEPMNENSHFDNNDPNKVDENQMKNIKVNLHQQIKTENNNASKALLCTPRFDWDGLIQTFSGMLMHCNHDARGFQGGDAASMDSTIYTSGSINL